MVPIRRPLGRSQSSGWSLGSRFLLVMMFASREPVGDLEAAAERAHVGDHLVGARVALVRAEDGDAAGLERVRERLRVGDDGGHVLLAEREQLGGRGGERGDAVDLVGGGERGEDGVEQLRRQRRGRSRPSRPTAGRRTSCRRCRSCTAAPSASGSWNWPPAISPSWCAPSKKTLPPHSSAIVGDLAHRQREEGHARAERDQLRAGACVPSTREGVEVDLELVRRRTGRRRCSGRGCRPGRRGGC